MPEVQLRGQAVTEDPRLDRVVEFDARSRAYPIRAVVGDRPRRGYTWRVGWPPGNEAHLDQGQEGACVGFAWTHEAIARPALVQGLTADTARRIYRRAQQLDPWAGEDYEGTSVLAGVKACRELGWYGEFRWAFGEDDLALAIGYRGPVVIGSWWWSGMWTPDSKGYIHPTGRRVGGHAYLAYGYSVARRAYKIWNSWGPDWGVGGMAWVDQEEMAYLLDDYGEACVPSVRMRPAA